MSVGGCSVCVFSGEVGRAYNKEGDRTPFARLCESDGCWVSSARCVPALLLGFIVTFSFLPPRPLASTVNDKLELQECLEHGRIAKVRPRQGPLLGGREKGRERDAGEQPPGL